MSAATATKTNRQQAGNRYAVASLLSPSDFVELARQLHGERLERGHATYHLYRLAFHGTDRSNPTHYGLISPEGREYRREMVDGVACWVDWDLSQRDGRFVLVADQVRVNCINRRLSELGFQPFVAMKHDTIKRHLLDLLWVREDMAGGQEVAA